MPENEIDLKCSNVEGVEERGSASPYKEDADGTANSLDDSAVTENNDSMDKSADEAKETGNATKEEKEKSPAKKEVNSFFGENLKFSEFVCGMLMTLIDDCSGVYSPLGLRAGLVIFLIFIHKIKQSNLFD